MLLPTLIMDHGHDDWHALPHQVQQEQALCAGEEELVRLEGDLGLRSWIMRRRRNLVTQQPEVRSLRIPPLRRYSIIC